MRIQHNISAMNSYRNFSANTSNLSKNLEKLSTGYKINRAGDDAAGLAISEKMRAQITGIEGATKNAKDGISLIQTAEGALTEVHSMLNRMTTLAEQSANGTYDDSLDRQQLQKEVEALKSEIDRIADSTNYNGIKLLDGSLSGGSNVKGNITFSETVATKTAASMTAISGGLGAAAGATTEGDTISYTVRWKEGDVEKSETLKFTIDVDENNSNKFSIVASDGTKYSVNATDGKVADSEIGAAIVGEFRKNDSLNAAFSITEKNATGKPEFGFESKTEGSKGADIVNVDLQFTYGANCSTTASIGTSKKLGGGEIDTKTPGADVNQVLKFDNIKVLNGTATNYTGKTLEQVVQENTFEIDGKKFVLFAGNSNNDLNKLKEAAGSDVNFIQLGGTNKAATNSDYVTDGSTGANSANSDAITIASELKRVTGHDFDVAQLDSTNKPVTTGGTFQVVLKGDFKLSREGKSLDLQIGDTADKFNKMSVSVKDMHAESIGIGDVDISSQEGAAKALDQIKAAINNVSDQRGSLGALQNRLDHTLNNLGVMRENIQNAESLIRDTDVAEEMMTYTKNNILNQSAQAMLAQANQLPQGVLQLLG